jgi:DNA-binding transcriptional LysR family regulator
LYVFSDHCELFYCGFAVRLATAENLANPLIVPPLATLFARYPDLSIDVVTGSQTVNPIDAMQI